MSISLSAVNNFLCGTRCMAGDLTVDRSGGGNGTTTVILCDTRTNRTNGTMGAALAPHKCSNGGCVASRADV